MYFFSNKNWDSQVKTRWQWNSWRWGTQYGKVTELQTDENTQWVATWSYQGLVLLQSQTKLKWSQEVHWMEAWLKITCIPGIPASIHAGKITAAIDLSVCATTYSHTPIHSHLGAHQAMGTVALFLWRPWSSQHLPTSLEDVGSLFMEMGAQSHHVGP